MTSKILSFKEINEFIIKTNKDLLIFKEPKSLYDPINYLFSQKGKQIRSMLLCISYNIYGGDIKDIKKLIIAVESLHNFTLIHDDVMDHASLRRGNLSINKKWSNNQAILSGDALIIYAYNHMLDLKISNKKILKKFTKTAIEICEGQQLDLDMQNKKTISLNNYFKMIDLKTGSLIKFCLASAASLTIKGSKEINKINKIGYYLGQLFQIQDDYLDLYGTTSSTGKVLGGDIIECKKSFLYITALGLCGNKEELISLYHSKNENKLKQICDIYTRLGVQEITQIKIKEITQIIFNVILDLNLDDDRKKIFLDFLSIISNRKQ